MNGEVLVVVAQQFNGHELWTLLHVLRSQGYAYEVVSNEHLVWDERTKSKHTVERTYYDLDPEYEASHKDGLALIMGGPHGLEFYWEDPAVLAILKAFRGEGKPMAGVCCAAPLLAPVCEGATISCWPLIKCTRYIKQHGCTPTTVSLTVDPHHKIATAENRFVTEMWAEEFCHLMQGKPPIYALKDSGFQPNMKRRKMPPAVEAAIKRAKKRKAKGEGEQDEQ